MVFKDRNLFSINTSVDQSPMYKYIGKESRNVSRMNFTLTFTPISYLMKIHIISKFYMVLISSKFTE